MIRKDLDLSQFTEEERRTLKQHDEVRTLWLRACKRENYMGAWLFIVRDIRGFDLAKSADDFNDHILNALIPASDPIERQYFREVHRCITAEIKEFSNKS